MAFSTDFTRKSGVFYRFNAKNWHFRQILREKVAFFTDLTRKIGDFYRFNAKKLAFFGVNFILQKIWLCKKNDKYQVCSEETPMWIAHLIMNYIVILVQPCIHSTNDTSEKRSCFKLFNVPSINQVGELPSREKAWFTSCTTSWSK